MIDVAQSRFGSPGGAFRLDLDRLTVDAGEPVVVLGPTGSGKTTLPHVVAGIPFWRPATIRVADTEIPKLSHRARRAFHIVHVGMGFQEFELLDDLPGHGRPRRAPRRAVGVVQTVERLVVARSSRGGRAAWARGGPAVGSGGRARHAASSATDPHGADGPRCVDGSIVASSTASAGQRKRR